MFFPLLRPCFNFDRRREGGRGTLSCTFSYPGMVCIITKSARLELIRLSNFLTLAEKGRRLHNKENPYITTRTMQRRLVQRLSQTHITIPCTSTTSIPSRHLTSLYSQGNCNNNSYKYNNSAFFSTSQPQKQQQQQQRKEKEEERDRVPIADLPGGVLERDAFRTIIPPSAEDIDASTGKPYGRLTPEELDNLREESFKRRMKRGVEYNPFRAIKEPHKMPATRVTGASPQSPPEMAPIPDMGPERNRLMPDATVQPFTPEQRAMAQQRAEQQRIVCIDRTSTTTSTSPLLPLIFIFRLFADAGGTHCVSFSAINNSFWSSTLRRIRARFRKS